MDQDHRNKSTLSSSSSAHNLNRACNFFMLCRTFPSRQRSESKASRKTGELIISFKNIFIFTFFLAKIKFLKML